MFARNSSDAGLALAATAILLQLIEDLVTRGIIASPSSLLLDAVELLDASANSERRAIEEAMRIIREELLPKLSSGAS